MHIYVKGKKQKRIEQRNDDAPDGRLKREQSQKSDFSECVALSIVSLVFEFRPRMLTILECIRAFCLSSLTHSSVKSGS